MIWILVMPALAGGGPNRMAAVKNAQAIPRAFGKNIVASL